MKSVRAGHFRRHGNCIGRSDSLEAHHGLRSRGPWGVTIAKINAKVTALRLKLDKLELRWSRVWKLNDGELIESSETARRLEEIHQRKFELQSLVVAELEVTGRGEYSPPYERALCLDSSSRPSSPHANGNHRRRT